MADDGRTDVEGAEGTMTDAGDGVVDDEPGAATEKQASTGPAQGPGGLGLGTLDQGAAAGVAGAGPLQEGDASIEGETGMAQGGGAGESTELGVPTISGADRATPGVAEDR